MVRTPEFDKLVCDSADRSQRLFGKNHDLFIYFKARWLWKYLTENSCHINLNNNYQLLDYGCGTGEILRWLKVFGFPGQLHGADISKAMLAEAENGWDIASKPLFSFVGETKTNYADESFSCIVATCVFHHIAPDKRDAVLAEIKRILTTGGIIVIFEHNPLNPLTRLIVKRAAIDHNAILLYPAETRRRLQKATLENNFLKYISFFPSRIKLLNSLEKYLSWCPLGAQYVAVGHSTKTFKKCRQ